MTVRLQLQHKEHFLDILKTYGFFMLLTGSSCFIFVSVVCMSFQLAMTCCFPFFFKFTRIQSASYSSLHFSSLIRDCSSIDVVEINPYGISSSEWCKFHCASFLVFRLIQFQSIINTTDKHG